MNVSSKIHNIHCGAGWTPVRVQTSVQTQPRTLTFDIIGDVMRSERKLSNGLPVRHHHPVGPGLATPPPLRCRHRDHPGPPGKTPLASPSLAMRSEACSTDETKRLEIWRQARSSVAAIEAGEGRDEVVYVSLRSVRCVL